MKLFFATFIVTGFVGIAFFTFGSQLDLPQVAQIADFKLDLGKILGGDTPETVPATERIQPAITLALASGEEQARDLEALFDSMDLGFYSFPIQGFVKGIISSTDATRRPGAIGYYKYGATKPSILAFVPVLELDPFVDMLGDVGEIKEGDPRKLQLPNGEQFFFNHQRGFVFFANERDLLEVGDIDPEAWLSELPASNNVTLKLDSTRIPSAIRKKVLADLKKSIWSAAAKSKNFTDPKHRRGLDQALTAQTILLQEIDQFVIGLDVDTESGKITVDWEVIGSPLSTFAKYGKKARSMPPSRFTRFRLDDATVNMNFRSPILQEHTFELRTLAELLEVVAGLPDENLDRLANESGKAIKRTLKKGVIDGAIVGKVEKNRVNFGAIVHMQDTRQIAKIVDTLNRPSGFGNAGQKMIVNRMAGSYRGINFYQYMETMDKGPLAQQRVVYLFGVGRSEILLGIGSNPMPLIKRCIDACNGEIDSDPADFDCQIRLADLGKYDANTEFERRILNYLSDSDQLMMRSEFTDRGTRSTIELDIAFLQSCWEIGSGTMNDAD